MSEVIQLSHPDRVSSIDDHQHGRGGDLLGEDARGSASSPGAIQPPTIECLWVVRLPCCNDYRRFASQAEATEFVTEHWNRYHVRAGT